MKTRLRPAYTARQFIPCGGRGDHRQKRCDLETTDDEEDLALPSSEVNGVARQFKSEYFAFGETVVHLDRPAATVGDSPHGDPIIGAPPRRTGQGALAASPRGQQNVDVWSTQPQMPPLNDQFERFPSVMPFQIWGYGRTQEGKPGVASGEWEQADSPKFAWAKIFRPVVQGFPVTPLVRLAFAGHLAFEPPEDVYRELGWRGNKRCSRMEKCPPRTTRARRRACEPPP